MDDFVNHSMGYFPKYVVVGKPGDNASPDIFGDIEGSTDYPDFRLESGQSVCSATNRLFKIGDIYVLDHLKKWVVHFGLMWNFVVSRSGASLRYNRFTCPGISARKVILRTTSSIPCGCGWYIRFKWVVPSKGHGVDSVKITYICGSHTNICDPSNVDQLVLARIRSRSYKKCTDQVLSEIMVRMSGLYSINVQSMVEILRKTLPERKDMDRHVGSSP